MLRSEYMEGSGTVIRTRRERAREHVRTWPRAHVWMASLSLVLWALLGILVLVGECGCAGVLRGSGPAPCQRPTAAATTSGEPAPAACQERR